MRLQDKVAIVTGAAAGIGRASALLFAREGAKVVVVTDRNVEGAEQTVATITREGGDGLFVQASVAVESDVRRVVAETVGRYGALHVVFSNAAIALGTDDHIETLVEEDWDRIQGVNLKGVYLLVKHAAPEIRKSGGGAIVNTGSLNGLIAMGAHAYAASKAALASLTRSLAQELGPDGIRVNTLVPGYVDTEMTRCLRRLQPNMTEEEQDERMHRFAGRTPLRRIAQPEELARPALFLASDDASFITGQLLVVDGGYSIQ
jgi:NAD(P)-dependent dehydrogenase (short-subunit alcohol dehydrogenase family)